jgi:serine/threonine protein kinase
MTDGRVISDTPGQHGEIAGYRLRSVLGEGGMGVVYLAERPQGGLCALKVLSGKLGVDPSSAARFRREAAYAETLEHPHILELYDAGETPAGGLFFAMQYVPGADLGVLLARAGVLDVAAAVSIVGQVGEALDCAHATGLIHRDVKPGNILIAQDHAAGPYAFLTDFGLSKNPSEDSIELTKQGQFVGTTAYTAPEEILAQPRDHRVDIYSLGCVLYQALTGEPPFVRERDLDVMYAHIGDPRPHASERRPDLPPGIDAIIATAMAISPTDRYPSCAAFIAAVRGVMPQEAASPAGAPCPTPAPTSDPTAPTVNGSSPGAAPSTPSAGDRGATPAPREVLRLIVRGGAAAGRELIVDDELALGRLITLDGAIASDLEISRRHARIRHVARDGFVVQDEYSANGTFVNGERIERMHPLAPGDELRIGSTVFVVAPTVAQSPPAPTKRVAVHLEFDTETGELSVAIERGPTARIVRDGDDWRVQIP